jgi:hypothetical protein
VDRHESVHLALLGVDRHRATVVQVGTALASGAPMVVDSPAIMCALMGMGLPHGDYTYDGKHGQKLFLLDEFDRLTEYMGRLVVQ